jgi:hypothetical protein
MKNKIARAMFAACSLTMLLGYSVGATAQQPTIPNPSFELPGFSPLGGWMPLPNSTFITDWETGGAGVDYFAWGSHGNFSVNYVRGPGDYGWIETSITGLINGTLYDVSFDVQQGCYLPSNPICPGTALTTTVVSNSSMTSQTYINTVPFVWQRQHLFFVAAGPSATSTLRFASALTGSRDDMALLDNVAIAAVPTSNLKVVKLVHVVAPAQAPSTQLTFVVKVDCSIVLNNTNYPRSQSFPFTYPPGPAPAQAPMTGIPTGSTCTISENPLPPTTPVPNAGCPSGYAAWGPVQYPDSNNSNATVQSVVMGASSDTLYVRNTLACTAAPPTGVLTIKKVVINNANPNANMSGIHYPMQVQCGSVFTTNFQMPDTSNSLTHTVPTPIGATCHVVEFWQNIPLPPGDKLCPAGQVLRWSAPIYSPASITGSGTITVQNTLKCGLEGPRASTCKEPMIQNAAGSACVCPQDFVQRGQACVKSASCVPPAKLNRRGDCDCPKDMVLKGDSCVEQIRGRPEASPKEIIKNSPGAVAPSRGGTEEGKPGRR